VGGLVTKSCTSRDVRVFYVDDTRWKGRPDWTNSLERWETYLDKADWVDFARYCNLRPDVVFAVTPDFTHSGIARSWLSRAALVFVEKPFDSQSENVDDLLRGLGQRRSTAVVGLDHYQFYALPVHELKLTIVEPLCGALAEVKFSMAETRPIELDRVRTLQYGLWLVPASTSAEAAPVGIWQSAVVLDLARNTDERIYFNLVGDLIFFPGDAENENVWLGEWKQRSRAVVVGGTGAFTDAVASAGISENLCVYRWSGGEEVALLGTAVE
jgi:hypothetical protein